MIETAQAVGSETFNGLGAALDGLAGPCDGSAETFDGPADPPRSPPVPLLARVPFATALRLCGLFLGMWIVGNWFAQLQHSLRGLHTACEVVAACGCLLFVGSSYVAIRAWQMRHPR